MAPPTTSVARSSTGRTLTFTYSAAAGGLVGGTVTLVVPAGWSVPSKFGTAAEYTTASAGTVSVVDRTIHVSNLTLAGGQKLTLTYGSRAANGRGATAPSTASTQTWVTSERSSASGVLTRLASSPVISIT